MPPEQIGIIGALSGVLITSLVNLANNWMTKRSEERTKIRELVINAAIENWKEKTEQTLKLQAMHPSPNARLYPLDFFIVYMAKICDVALKPNVSHQEVMTKFREAGEMLEAVDRRPNTGARRAQVKARTVLATQL
jgi:hypothetical protein